MDWLLILKILLLPLATWRMYRLFSTDTGYKQWLRKFRVRLGVKYATKDTGVVVGAYHIWENDYSKWSTQDGSIAEGLMCCWCATLWWGAILTILALYMPLDIYLALVLPLNVSTICLKLEKEV